LGLPGQSYILRFSKEGKRIAIADDLTHTIGKELSSGINTGVDRGGKAKVLKNSGDWARGSKKELLMGGESKCGKKENLFQEAGESRREGKTFGNRGKGTFQDLMLKDETGGKRAL